MNGPDPKKLWRYTPSGKERLTGKPVSTVNIKIREYAQTGSFVPGRERVSQPYPPLIRKKKDQDQPV
jgi:hypothetical protein